MIFWGFLLSGYQATAIRSRLRSPCTTFLSHTLRNLALQWQQHRSVRSSPVPDTGSTLSWLSPTLVTLQCGSVGMFMRSNKEKLLQKLNAAPITYHPYLPRGTKCTVTQDPSRQPGSPSLEMATGAQEWLWGFGASEWSSKLLRASPRLPAPPTQLHSRRSVWDLGKDITMGRQVLPPRSLLLAPHPKASQGP